MLGGNNILKLSCLWLFCDVIKNHHFYSCRSPVLLSAVTCLPAPLHCMVLLDDNRIAMVADGRSAVQILPGQEYNISVILHIDAEEIQRTR